MASPTVQTASENSGDSATPTITEPASATTGDLLIAVVGSADTGTAITGLTGWTQLAEGDDGVGNRYWYGYIIRGASAPDLVAAAANARWVAMCVRIDGHDPTEPLGASNADHASATGTGTAPDAPNVDPGSSDDYLAVLGVVQEGKGDNRFTDTTPSGYTEQADIGTTGGGAGTTHIGGAMNSLQYTGQAQNPGTHTSGTNDGWIAITMIVSPAAVAITEVTGTAEAGAEAVGTPSQIHTVDVTVEAGGEAVGSASQTHQLVGTAEAGGEASGTVTAIRQLTGTSEAGINIGDSQFLELPGVAGHSASTPDHADLDITGDLEIIARVSSDDIASIGDNERIVEKANAYNFIKFPGSDLRLEWHDGTAFRSETSSVTLASVGITDAQSYWLRVTLDVDNGASDAEVDFYYSTDRTVDPSSVSWSALGATQLFGSTTSIRTTGDAAYVGLNSVGNDEPWQGNVYRAQIYDGIGGTLAADFNASNFSVGDSDTDTAVDSTGKTWTINGASSLISPGGVSLTQTHTADGTSEAGAEASGTPTQTHQLVGAAEAGAEASGFSEVLLTVEVTGTSESGAEASGTPVQTHTVDAVGEAGAEASGTLTQTQLLNITIESAGEASGTPTQIVKVTGTVEAATEAQGVLVETETLDVTVEAAAEAQGTPTQTHQLVAAAEAGSEAVGSPIAFGTVEVTGTSEAAAEASGSPVAVSAAEVTGTSEAGAETSGALTQTHTADASSEAGIEASGTPIQTHQLTGTVEAAGEASGVLVETETLDGLSESAVEAAGTPIQTHQLTGTSEAGSEASGSPVATSITEVTGTSESATETSGVLQTVIQLTGTAETTTETAAALTVFHLLVATIESASESAGSLSQTQRLMAAHEAAAEALGNLTILTAASQTTFGFVTVNDALLQPFAATDVAVGSMASTDQQVGSMTATELTEAGATTGSNSGFTAGFDEGFS